METDRTLRADAVLAGREGKTMSPQEIEFVELQKDNVLQKLEANPSSGFDSNAKFFTPAGESGSEFDCGAFRSQMNSSSLDNSVLPQKSGEEDELFEEEQPVKKEQKADDELE